MPITKSPSNPGSSKEACKPVNATKETCPEKDNNLSKGIDIIKNSKFSKTDEGKKVFNRIEEYKDSGKINFEKMDKDIRGKYYGKGAIGINDIYKENPDAIASELVHEATHSVNKDDFPASKNKQTIDEEMRTNTNQLDLYEEQRETGFRDPELEDRRDARNDGNLRDNVRERYPDSAEHLE